MRIFRSRIQQGLTDGTPIATFIDEVSMLTPIVLGQILGRYSHPDLTDFKQGAFILVGDMWQVFSYMQIVIVCIAFLASTFTSQFLTSI